MKKEIKRKLEPLEERVCARASLLTGRQGNRSLRTRQQSGRIASLSADPPATQTTTIMNMKTIGSAVWRVLSVGCAEQSWKGASEEDDVLCTPTEHQPRRTPCSCTGQQRVGEAHLQRYSAVVGLLQPAVA